VSEIFGYVAAGRRAAAPRTALHRHFSELTRVTEAGVSELAKAVSSNGDIAGLRATVTQHASEVKGLDQQVRSLMEEVSKLGKVIGAGGTNGTGNTGGVAPIFSERRKLCLRALNRIEDILLDKDPKLDKNRAKLEDALRDSLGRSATAALGSIGENVDNDGDWQLCHTLDSDADRIPHLLVCARLRGVVMTHPGLNSDSIE
jgi:hypothetical protein